MPHPPAYTTADEISWLNRLARGISHRKGRGAVSFYMAAKIILLDRRYYDPGVDVQVLKAWIRERLDGRPGPARDRLLVELAKQEKAG